MTQPIIPILASDPAPSVCNIVITSPGKSVDNVGGINIHIHEAGCQDCT